jgi:hypothetical protein
MGDSTPVSDAQAEYRRQERIVQDAIGLAEENRATAAAMAAHEADQRLRDAAPRLLLACKALLRVIDTFVNLHEDQPDAERRDISAARAAVAAAEGGAA